MTPLLRQLDRLDRLQGSSVVTPRPLRLSGGRLLQSVPADQSTNETTATPGASGGRS